MERETKPGVDLTISRRSHLEIWTGIIFKYKVILLESKAKKGGWVESTLDCLRSVSIRSDLLKSYASKESVFSCDRNL
jgi:hypothetical protein